MSVQITGTYQGNKKVQLVHGPSGATITTVPPVDNQGDGSSFSPTDLASGSLGACMLTIIALVAERDGIDIRGSSFSVTKEMQASPRRIARLSVVFHLPEGLTADQQQKLKNAALTCPVHKSLHPDIEIPVEFIFDVSSL
jgi:putative redox protein